VGVEADRKSGEFSKMAKLEIQRNLENWKFNKSGFITKTAKQESYEAVFQEFRCPGEQEFRNAVVCPSGTLPPGIPQIWNGRFCTLIV